MRIVTRDPKKSGVWRLSASLVKGADRCGPFWVRDGPVADATAETHHDEPRHGRFGLAGGCHEAIDQPLHVVVCQHARPSRGIDALSAVEQGVMIGEKRLPAGGRRLGESSRMGELQGDDKIVGAAMSLAGGPADGRKERFEAVETPLNITQSRPFLAASQSAS